MPTSELRLTWLTRRTSTCCSVMSIHRRKPWAHPQLPIRIAWGAFQNLDAQTIN